MSNTTDTQSGSVFEGCDFTNAELAFFGKTRAQVLKSISSKSPARQHRMLLGAASELVDAAADVAAATHPGMRVVSLGLLAERLGRLAIDFDGLVVEDVEDDQR